MATVATRMNEAAGMCAVIRWLYAPRDILQKKPSDEWENVIRTLNFYDVLCVWTCSTAIYMEKSCCLSLSSSVLGGVGVGWRRHWHRQSSRPTVSQQVEPVRIFSMHTAQSQCFPFFHLAPRTSCPCVRVLIVTVCACVCASSVCAVSISNVFHLCERNRFAEEKIYILLYRVFAPNVFVQENVNLSTR